jgi:hypothetical protein
VLEVPGARSRLGLGRELDVRLARELRAELMEVRHLDPRDPVDRGAQVLAQTLVEAGEQHAVPGRGQALGDRDREQGLAAAGRPGHRGATALDNERQHPRLILRQLDDLAVLLVETQLQWHADLDAEPERLG